MATKSTSHTLCIPNTSWSFSGNRPHSQENRVGMEHKLVQFQFFPEGLESNSVWAIL